MNRYSATLSIVSDDNIESVKHALEEMTAPLKTHEAITVESVNVLQVSGELKEMSAMIVLLGT